MKITDIQTHLVNATSEESANRPRGRTWLFISVHTDAGIEPALIPEDEWEVR